MITRQIKDKNYLCNGTHVLPSVELQLLAVPGFNFHTRALILYCPHWLPAAGQGEAD